MTDVAGDRQPGRESRFEARVDGELAGSRRTTTADDLIVFTHTEVDDAFEGHGVGSALARGALDDVRADGTRKVLPRCPFISGWIEKHPDYQDLVESSLPGAAAVDHCPDCTGPPVQSTGACGRKSPCRQLVGLR